MALVRLVQFAATVPPHSRATMAQYRYDAELQEIAAARFGEMLRRWREQQGWTQYTAYKWAKSAGFVAMAPSTLSVMENGKAPKPRPETFFALAEIQRRLAMREFDGITDPALAQLVETAQPLRGDDGRVWGPAEFWSCHVGLLEVPRRYAAPG
jgi:transcriptional regulator with XRE-family HTH domain